jgi:DNA-binding protein Fis
LNPRSIGWQGKVGFRIDFTDSVMDNSALFFVGAFMSSRTPSFHLLLCSSDASLPNQLHQVLLEATIMVAKDVAAAQKVLAKRAVDGLLVEAKRGQDADLTALHRAIDPARTFFLVGSRSMLRNAAGLVRGMVLSNGSGTQSGSADFFLDDYVVTKLGHYSKQMKNGSALALHRMLIQAIERPLISFVLKETDGNQILAAHVLGVNRNTLRKKMREHRIQVPRERIRRTPQVRASA